MANVIREPDWLDRRPWLVCVLPLVVFLLVTSIEPAPPDDEPARPAATASEGSSVSSGAPSASPGAGSAEPAPSGRRAWGFSIPYAAYPAVYTIKIALTLAAIALVARGYRRHPFSVGRSAWVFGLVGAALWIGLCRLDLERTLVQPWLDRIGFEWLISQGRRAAYNPLERLADRPALAFLFLAVRFLGLVAVVPLVEEFFLRGFLMRFVQQADWWEVPFGRLTPLAAVVGTAAPVLMHPAELLAAAVWFSWITWLMARTRNIWDCVAAHATTNLLLGVYVVASGDWRLM